METWFQKEGDRRAKWGKPFWVRRAVLGVGSPYSTVRRRRAANWRFPEAGRAEVTDGAWRSIPGLRSKALILLVNFNFAAAFGGPCILRPRPKHLPNKIQEA
jgi:hypothetical protein